MLANHFASAALWILPTGTALLWRAKEKERLEIVKPALLGLLPGLSVYAYLPLRAAFVPLVNWGSPDTFKQFWWMISRGGYSSAQLSSVPGLAGAQISAWWMSLWQKGQLWLLPLAGVGLHALWPRKELFYSLLAAIVLTLYAALIVNKTPTENQWLVLIFALPATALFAPLAGLGLARLQGYDSAASAKLGASVALGLALWAAFSAYPKEDRSGSYVAWDYAHDQTLSLPRNSYYYAEGDYHFLPLLYLQAVEGRRTDVLAILDVLCGEAWYLGLLQWRDPQIRPPLVGRPPQPTVIAMAQLNADRRPLRIGPFSEIFTTQTVVGGLKQDGLLRMAGPGARPGIALAWAARLPARTEEQLEKSEADLLPWYTVSLVQQGNDALAQGRAQEAAWAYRRALERPGAKPEAPIAANLSMAYEALGRKDLAVESLRRALRVDPTFAAAQQRLDKLLAPH
jgi:hypothetical protein